MAQPADVQIRSGSHEDYSRLVFDWPTKPAFNVTSPSPGTLEITFNSEANLNVGQGSIEPVSNILGVEVLSQSPAKVKVTIPEGSRHRSFFAGSKMVLDVYNPPGGALPKKNLSVENAATPQAPAPSTPKAQPQQAEPSDTASTVDATAMPDPDELADAGNSERRTAAEVQLVQEEEIEQAKVITNPNLISISSSKSTGLAVFERGDELWIVNDKKDALINPQVSGPNADYFLPLKELDIDKGKAFITKTVARNFIRTQGGGLLWKVIITPREPRSEPVLPERMNVPDNAARGGKIVWPFEEPGQVMMTTDPLTGQPIIIVTAQSSKDFSGRQYSFVDFDVMPSYAGLVIVPKVDDLSVAVKSYGVEISRPAGLAIVSEKIIAENAPVRPKDSAPSDASRIFDFANWQLGGVKALADNQNIILSGINELPKNARDEDLMTLAKTNLANAMGAEALGFLDIIESRNEDIANTPEFRAIRGAAHAIDYKTEKAFADLSVDDLQRFEEIGFWKAYALADLGDWQQAIEVLPEKAEPLYDYPDLVQTRVGLVAAEVALRGGDVDMADEILTLIDRHKDDLYPPQKAALSYLQGEAARQKGDYETTMQLWEPLTTGSDDLYRAKAGLALTRLQVDQNELPIGKAIDNLERLRYAWRGDELEAQINYWLGRTYFEGREFVKGLNIMREAAAVAAGTDFGQRITNEMADVFSTLFLTDALDKITPLQAMALYEQFTELVPTGERGDKIVERLADRLTQADILDKAGELLSYQLTHRLDGLEAYNIGAKLAAIRLIDNKPDEAIAALNIAAQKLKELPEEQQTQARTQTIALLRARALSRQGRPDQALVLLNNLDPNPTVNRLRADIAWTAGYWDDAAIALEDVILDQNMSLSRPLDKEDSALIMQRAVALSLSGNRIALANMREKYAGAMAQTDQARVFEVITRPRQSSALADRDTLMGIVSEVDLFSDFLDSYKSTSTEPSN